MKRKEYIKEINKYSEKLSPELQKKFDEVLLKIRFSNVRDYDAEEFTHHCLDLFLQAEEQSIPIEELLGKSNLDEFCNDFISESVNSYSVFEKLYWKVHLIPLILLIYTGIFDMLFSSLIYQWIEGNTGFTVSVTVSTCLNGFFVILLISFLLSRINRYYFIFDSDDKKTNRKYTFILWLILTGCISFCVITKQYLSITIFEINYLVFMGILILIYILQQIYERSLEQRC